MLAGYAVMAAIVLAEFVPTLALAQTEAPSAGRNGLSGVLNPVDILYLALLAMMIGTTMLTAVFIIRQRVKTAAENDLLRASLADSRAEAESRAALLAGADERILIYSGPGAPEVLGALPGDCQAPLEEKRFLAFADWMPASTARTLADSIDRLRGAAKPFCLEIELAEGQVVEATGRTIGALATVRFTRLQGLRERLREIEAAEQRALATIETMQRLFDAAPIPIWLREQGGRLVWVNESYASAVDAGSVAECLERQSEFLSQQDRLAIAAHRAEAKVFSGKLSTVVAADRRNFAVVEADGPLGSAGLAADVSETEQVRMELRQTIDSQSETLNQLTTAVARFDEKTRLAYYNAAFQRLFDLTNTYLDSQPDHLALLDHLRTAGILPIEKEFRSELREQDLAAYRATEPTETLWHLSDGRTLRVIATPQPRGGATWVFEDITEKLELESQVKATVRLQRETIDYLREAVAVFSSDGRLRLSNPAFAELWGLDAEYLRSRPRIHALPELCNFAIVGGDDDNGEARGWTRFSQAVTAFDEAGRDTETGEFALTSGHTVAYGIVPLPNGQTMLTFSDISDAREAERMLRERNEALEQANQIKNDFVQHVNYELRSPLTNIIGFSALLRTPETGPLNERQSEYLDYISTSTSQLLTIVNDILDLATIDAGIMELELDEVDIAKTVSHAADGVRERLTEAGVTLDIDLAEAGETLRADGPRLTQILFNLLSNAANFAPAGSAVALRARRRDDTIRFEVTDRGPGIARDNLDKIFERFEANPNGGRQSGAGLGLSIVKSFVELHRGTIEIVSAPGEGTTVICTLPVGPTSPDRQENSRTHFEDAAE
ncbi:PAS domain-containing sensor histidine kinase [Aurantimonas endophytica]|uniref:histidine kinase n=1 Tax=Aurantimonas endophytica TaxID=1522175 RepID=A0A7W6HHE2_9HYPH|nr:PAS domain-containing sensor histidine kinase [Aurantimonas endophytica]MBB4005271.1 signal transduction histidine kinase [Aurantimonas endophytica]